jgi:hypothetical protein
MRGRNEGLAAVHYRSKNRLDKANPRIVPPQMFAIVRAGCRQFGNSQAWDKRLTISRIIAAYINASALAHSLS